MKKANPIKCVRAKTYWIGYLKNMSPLKYCKEYCVYRSKAVCTKEEKVKR